MNYRKGKIPMDFASKQASMKAQLTFHMILIILLIFVETTLDLCNRSQFDCPIGGR
jgi:hypothetical protein